MGNGEFFQEDFTAAVVSAGARARLETLKAGVPVFYWDSSLNLDIMEQPNGRRFEIRFLAGVTRDRNYSIIRELNETG